MLKYLFTTFMTTLKAALPLLLITSVLGQQLPSYYPATQDATIAKSTPNTNYGSSPYLTIKKTQGEQRALVEFNLDGTQQLFDIVNSPFLPDYTFDCNHWFTVLGASLNFQLANVSNCQGGCQIDLYSNVGQFSSDQVTWNCPFDLNVSNNYPDCPAQWNGGCLDDENLLATQTVTDGQTGVVSFDITSLVLPLKKPHLNVTFLLTLHPQSGEVSFWSSNSNFTPSVNVTNREQPIEESCERRFVLVNGLNVSYLICLPENGTANYSANPLVINHGMPEYSYLYGYLGQLIANDLGRPVYAMDWMGVGFSQFVTDLTVFDYSWENQSLILQGFVENLNLTGAGQKIHSMTFEVGSLPGTYFQYTNQEIIASIIFTTESYLNTCPDTFDNTNVGNGVPPSYGGVGICQNETLLFRQEAGAPLNSEWDFWGGCLYESYACACEYFYPSFVDAESYYQEFNPANPPPFEVLEILASPYLNSTQDPTCASNRVLMFPINVPVPPLPNSPPQSNYVIKTINEFMRNTTIPKLMLYWDNPTLLISTQNVQVPYAEQIFPNLTTANVGCGGCHFAHYSLFYNHYLTITDFIRQVEAQ